MPHPSKIVTYNIIQILALVLSACQPVSDVPSTITVGHDSHPQDPGHYTDITSATDSTSPGGLVEISEGIYIVDNPIILHTRDVKLRGAGADKTIILAKNAHKPVFLLEANGITIDAITINALIDSGPGRASFAIQVREGYGHCKILNTKILNTAASAIIGHSAPHCTLANNVILNSGDDAVRLHGNRLTVINNTIIQYFDEALDLASGSSIVVTSNYVANGRIGIVVDDSTNTFVSRNHVENQMLEGIVTGTDPGAIVTANTVRNAGKIAYNLFSPQSVTYNLADGTHKIGYRLTDMTNGIFFRNVSRGSNLGFKFEYTRALTASHNKNNELDVDSRMTSEPSEDLSFYGNCEQRSRDSGDTTCTSYPQGTRLDLKAAAQTAAELSHEIYTFTPSVEIQGQTPSDEKLANHVAALLKYYNPGFLSLQVDGEVMKSKITADLYETLKGTGELGIGLVRAPYLLFSNGQRSFFWYLSVGERDVIVVSSIHDGPRVKFSFLDNNGELSFLDSATLLKDKILLKLLK